MKMGVLFRVISAAALGLLLATTGCSGGGSNEPDPPAEDTTPPPAPSGLQATSGDSEIELRWSAVSASDLDGYNIYRSTSSIGSVSGLTPLNSAPRSEASFTDTSVSNGTTYYYRVTAVDNSDNESSPTGESEVTPFPTPPTRP